jgi:hypothetical protein
MSEMKSENPGFNAGVFLLKFRVHGIQGSQDSESARSGVNEKFAEEYPWKRFESVFNI